MKKLLIFDIDGTVLNTLDTIHYFLNEALKKNGLGLCGFRKRERFCWKWSVDAF